MDQSAEKRRMLSGEPYLAGAPELLAERARCRGLVDRYNAVPFADHGARDRALRELLGSVGADATVMAPFQCDYGAQISIGDRSFINYGARTGAAPADRPADTMV